MKHIHLVFPHQLFKSVDIPKQTTTIYIVEEYLFFKQYKFHKQKIAFHRATMKQYEVYLKELKYKVEYIEAIDEKCDIRVLLQYFYKNKTQTISYTDPTDCWLEQRITQVCDHINLERIVLNSPLFLNTKEDLASFFNPSKKKFHQTTFYTQQRKERDILIDAQEKPMGGKWTFDAENRKKYPAKKTPPVVFYPDNDIYYQEAITYTEKHFQEHLGTLSTNSLYPTNYTTSTAWLNQFLEQRFHEFGTYEDAIVKDNSILNHSVLTPMLNVGLITPNEILKRSLEYAEKNNVPINSTEGFIRQIVGWREFIRGIYEAKGTFERTHNYWKFTKKIPTSFYEGTTGIDPIDTTIKKIMKTGYCHHIERLMILGNFMLLCEFDPDEVYKWFMELFIDAYDWVMVPNIYGMSQFSDGGLMATKPYISGSNYIIKMSNYKKGDWQQTWDGLFWRFMDKHRVFFKQNPRLGMLVNMFDKMPLEKKETHHKNAQLFLDIL